MVSGAGAAEGPREEGGERERRDRRTHGRTHGGRPRPGARLTHPGASGGTCGQGGAQRPPPTARRPRILGGPRQQPGRRPAARSYGARSSPSSADPGRSPHGLPTAPGLTACHAAPGSASSARSSCLPRAGTPPPLPPHCARRPAALTLTPRLARGAPRPTSPHPSGPPPRAADWPLWDAARDARPQLAAFHRPAGLPLKRRPDFRSLPPLPVSRAPRGVELGDPGLQVKESRAGGVPLRGPARL